MSDDHQQPELDGEGLLFLHREQSRRFADLLRGLTERLNDGEPTNEIVDQMLGLARELAREADEIELDRPEHAAGAGSGASNGAGRRVLRVGLVPAGAMVKPFDVLVAVTDQRGQVVIEQLTDEYGAVAAAVGG